MKKAIILNLVFFLAVSAVATAQIRHVPDEYPTIQAAIDAAEARDTVLVAQGTYYENIHFHGKNISLTSTNPEDLNVVAATVIDGSNAGSVVTFAGTETSDCLLTGFTITNGHSSIIGGGILGHYTYATITRCFITKNTADTQGGGIENCNGIISRCIITHNSAKIGGGLARCYGTISNCLITHNSASEGAGISRADDATIANCTIAFNNGTGLESCIGLITNCIVWPNGLSSCSTPTYSCFPGAVHGVGNIDRDPYFINPGIDDYRLQSCSPCIDSGTDPWPDEIHAKDIDGKIRQIDGNNDGVFIADMGSYEYGTVKTPLIAIQPTSIDFIAIVGVANPAHQILSIWNIGIGTLNWQVAENSSWLESLPESGNSQGEA